MQTTNPKSGWGTRGPDDDFYCHKYSVWYRVEDCVFRGVHKTYSGCVNCFQGYLNRRCVKRGTPPPVWLGADSPPRADRETTCVVLPMRLATRD
ncbi:MAG: hypothetical protein ACE5HU_05555 [Acidobacteriota bacterium]